eukprot:jgi/Galph1/364/GphlegSOOS_G5131.1
MANTTEVTNGEDTDISIVNHKESCQMMFDKAQAMETGAVGKVAPTPTNPAPPVFPNPVILGAASFSCTDFVLSAINAGLLPSTVASGVIGPAFFYGGIVQVFTGLLCFITRNTFGLLTLTSYGAFWIAVATLITLEEKEYWYLARM